MWQEVESTTVEIILYYLTSADGIEVTISTTVEIILYYLTDSEMKAVGLSTTVEIILYYLTPSSKAQRNHLQQ